MIPQKTNINVPFAQGLDTKTDPFQVQIGKFLALENSVFDKGGQLRKRNGFPQLTVLPTTSYSYLTTLNNNLTAFSNNIAAYSSGNDTWIQKGSITPLTLNTLPLIRNNLNQSQCDIAIASNGLACLVYSEVNNGTTVYKYSLQDSTTGQNIVAPTLIPAGSGAISGSARVWNLDNYFVLCFTNTISASAHLQYVAIPVYNPSTVSANVDIATGYGASSTLSWDGVVANNQLFIGYDTTTGGQSIKVTYLTPNIVASAGPPETPTTFSGRKATVMSLTADTSTNSVAVYVSIYDSSSSTGYVMAVNTNLTSLFNPVEVITSGTILNLSSAAQNGLCTLFYEVSNNYSYDSSIPTHYINGVQVNSSGTITVADYTVVRSVGLASKSFTVDGTIYFLAAYQSPYQPTYFLINGSTSVQAAPIVAVRLAYENGGGYLTTGLPNVCILNDTYYIPYLYKDLIAALSDANSAGTSTVGGIYSQTGIDLASIVFGTTNLDSAEIGSNLLFSGGFLWSYDGYLPVEQNFFLWPDSIEVTGSTSGGAMTAQQYFYQVVYEWSDNQGNIYRSAGSIPVTVTTTGSTSSVTVNGPYLRLTYKVANPVKITIYRYSAGQQVWYEITSITAPVLNNTTSDSWTYVDTVADSSISGNNILYTTGGVIEDTGAPGTNIISLFDTRLWMVDAEDRNLLWYSKQVIEGTPVEMSDLFTFYIAPTTAAQGSTGPITALAPMDDKLIIFKANAMYYINGTGPDNTGANNQYSQPIFITSTVGCSNQQSIVFMPQGLMFQSDKGIWLLGRDLNTQYIGAPVEQYNSSVVTSAVNVPETNQVRFTLSTGITLMYDYYYSQWGTFSLSALSSCLYENDHTFVDSYGRVFQERQGTYLDGSNPVLMSFTTGWLNMAGIQGYMRAFTFFLLGEFLTPCQLNMGVAYNYNPNITQTTLINLTNRYYTTPFGSGSSQSPFGQGSPFGGPGSILGDRVFLAQQRCQSFQISLQEVFDPSQGTVAGAGFTLSGLNLVYGAKQGWRTIGSNSSFGGGSNVG
jgi:hypothetical protein